MKQTLISTVLLVIIYFAFVSLGLPDSIFGISWPYMRIDFSKAIELAGIVTICGTLCTAISSIMSGHVLAKFGTGRVTFVSCLMTATGLIGYSIAPSFLWILPCIPLLGFGAGCIDCGLNIYIAGHYSSRHMNWLHCCWGIGATLGPIIMTAAISNGAGWRAGYRTISFIQFGLSAILFVSLGLWAKVATSADVTAGGHGGTAEVSADSDATAVEELSPEQKKKVRARALRMQVGIYITYTSCEFLVGLWSFSLLTMYRHVDAVTAGAWVSIYYGSLTAARFVTGVIVNRLGNRFMIKAGLIVALAGSAIYALPFLAPGVPGWFALIGLILIGAGFGPVYPCMTHETPRRFTEETSRKMIGYQTGAASLSGAVFPALVGLIGAHSTFEILPFTVAIFMVLSLAIMARLDRLTARGPL